MTLPRLAIDTQWPLMNPVGRQDRHPVFKDDHRAAYPIRHSIAVAGPLTGLGALKFGQRRSEPLFRHGSSPQL